MSPDVRLSFTLWRWGSLTLHSLPFQIVFPKYALSLQSDFDGSCIFMCLQIYSAIYLWAVCHFSQDKTSRITERQEEVALSGGCLLSCLATSKITRSSVSLATVLGIGLGCRTKTRQWQTEGRYSCKSGQARRRHDTSDQRPSQDTGGRHLSFET